MFEPIAGVIGGAMDGAIDVASGGRKLLSLSESDREMWYPLIGLKLEGAGLVDFIGSKSGAVGALSLNVFKVPTGDKLKTGGAKQAVGVHTRIEGNGQFNFGIIREESGLLKFGMSLAAEVEVKFGTTLGAKSMLRRSMELAKSMKKFKKTVGYGVCYKDHVAYWEEEEEEQPDTWGVYSPDDPENDKGPCSSVKAAVDEILSVKPECTFAKMKELDGQFTGERYYTTRTDGPTRAQTLHVVECTKFWFNADAIVKQAEAQYPADKAFQERREVQGMGWVGATSAGAWDTIKVMFQDRKHIKDTVLGMLVIKTDWVTKPLMVWQSCYFVLPKSIQLLTPFPLAPLLQLNF